MGVILYSDHQIKIRKLKWKFRWVNAIWILIVGLTLLMPYGLKLERDAAIGTYLEIKAERDMLEIRRELLSVLRTKSLSVGQALDVVDMVLSQVDVPIPMVLAVMAQESEFKPWARSEKDARSLMQVIPATYRIYANPLLRFGIHASDPILTTRAGISFLGDMKRTFKDWRLALRAYYAGPDQANNVSYNWYANAVIRRAVKYGMKL